MVRVAVAKLGELPDKRPIPKTVEATPLVLVRDGERIYCAYGICPHGRWLLGLGDYKEGRLRCKGHGAVYDLATGAGELNSYPLQIKVYKAEVVGDTIYVEV